MPYSTCVSPASFVVQLMFAELEVIPELETPLMIGAAVSGGGVGLSGIRRQALGTTEATFP